MLALRLALHLLANLDIDLEELGYAAVEADGLALVQIGLAVRCVDTFRRAGLEETRNMRVSAGVLLCEWWQRARRVEVGLQRGDFVGNGNGKADANIAMAAWSERIPAVHVRHHIDLGLSSCDLLLGRELGAAAKEERHLVCVVFVCESKDV